MKKAISLLLALAILCLPLAGCAQSDQPDEPSQTEPQEPAEPQEPTEPTEPTEPVEPVQPTEPEPTEPEEPEVPAWEWQYGTPEEHGLDGSVLSSLHDTYDTTQILASVVFKDGHIVDEYYKDGYDETTPFLLHSSSKSVTSALVGIAIEQGYIEGVDVPLSEYFPEILEFEDERWGRITLWHLLTHTSGIDCSDTGYWDAWRNSDNWIEYTFSRPITSEPGTVFDYATSNTHLLSAIVQIATGQTLYEFGKENLFDPVGMESVTCDTDPQGISDGGNGFHMSIYDMIRFGILYLNGGVWQGQQIVPAQWVEDSKSLQFERSTGSADYGYQWWVRTFGDEAYPAYFAQGHAGQYIFVVPALELVIAYTSNHTGSSSMYWQFVNDIVAACN